MVRGVDSAGRTAVSFLFLFLRTPIMKILIIGGGGREHAIAWKLRQSASVEKIWCAPGNGGISRDAECVPLNVGNVEAAADLATKLGADLTIVGPELPLVQGITDEFKQRGLAILGPPKMAAQLEGSKIFAKQFMTRNGIPTAGVYGAFESARAACAKLKSVAWPLVVKADGLCAGKGVLVTSAASDAQEFIERLMNGDEFGDAGKRVLLEEAIAGKELSYIILTDGTNFIPLAPTRDHKRAFDNDEGPNTGGMGTYSTDGMLTRELERQILEYNCRLGDPETQAILLRADFNFAAACMDAARGKLDGSSAKWIRGASVCVVMASEGYPWQPVLGKSIGGLEEAEKAREVVVFHAGTRHEENNYYTSGGRILGVTAVGNSLPEARRIAYDAASRIDIPGAHYRKDIGLYDSNQAKVAEVRANG